MKVLVLSGATYADPANRRLFDHVAGRGVEVLLALPRRARYVFAPAEVPETPWPTPGVTLARLDTWHVHENGTHIAMKGIPRLIREFSPDIIHCVMEPWSVTCLQVLAAMRGVSPRPVFGVQASETKPEQGGASTRLIRQTLYRRALARCDFFIGWSSPVVAAATRMGLNGQVTAVAPGVGIDPGEFKPLEAGERARVRSELGLGNDDFVVAYVGRLVEQKGVFDLVRAMDMVTATRQNMRLVLIGDGPARESLAALATTRPWLSLLPKRGRADIARILGAFDLFVLASRTTPSGEEQFGLVLAEAMSAGLPVIGSSCGAIPEVVGDGGWIFPEGDADSLARHITQGADSPTGLRERSIVARARAEERYSDDSVAEQMVLTWRQAALRARP